MQKETEREEKIDIKIVRGINMDWREDENLYIEKFKYQYITDALYGKIKNWNSNVPIFISAQTGCGKNHFIENCIIQEAKYNNSRILLLGNRTALNRQVKIRLAKILGYESELNQRNEVGIDEYTNFGTVEVYSYQKIGELLLRYGEKKTIEIISKNYQFLILDECHFFMADSEFNPTTELILNFICSNFRNSTRVYMTSTPDEVFGEIMCRDIGNSIFYQSGIPCGILTGIVYEFARDYRYVNVKTFKKIEDILRLIKKSDEKFLIFVNSKNDGAEIMNFLSGNVDFISSESKREGGRGFDTYIELVKNEKFSKRVLISTSVIENGINLCDKKLKNIVILTDDQTTFLQEIGRIRVCENDKINLYIPTSENQEFSYKLKALRDVNFAYEKFKLDTIFGMREYVLKKERLQDLSGYVYINYEKKVFINPLAFNRKKYFSINFYQKIQNQKDKGNHLALLEQKLNWINKTIDNVEQISCLSEEVALSDLDTFLSKYAEVKSCIVDQDGFRKELTVLIKNSFRILKNHLTNEAFGANLINKYFRDNSCKFNLITDRGEWSIEKII